MMSHFSIEQIQALQVLLEPKIEDIFEELAVGLRKNSKMFIGACPVHGGNNISAINVYHNLNSDGVFNWRCNTHHCEQHFKKTIVGLIRGILSNQEYGWVAKGDKEVTFAETVEWCEDFLQVKASTLKLEDIDFDKQNFIKSWLNKSQVIKGNNDFLLEGMKSGTDLLSQPITI